MYLLICFLKQDFFRRLFQATSSDQADRLSAGEGGGCDCRSENRVIE